MSLFTTQTKKLLENHYTHQVNLPCVATKYNFILKQLVCKNKTVFIEPKLLYLKYFYINTIHYNLLKELKNLKVELLDLNNIGDLKLRQENISKLQLSKIYTSFVEIYKKSLRISLKEKIKKKKKLLKKARKKNPSLCIFRAILFMVYVAHLCKLTKKEFDWTVFFNYLINKKLLSNLHNSFLMYKLIDTCRLGVKLSCMLILKKFCVFSAYKFNKKLLLKTSNLVRIVILLNRKLNQKRLFKDYFLRKNRKEIPKKLKLYKAKSKEKEIRKARLYRIITRSRLLNLGKIKPILRRLSYNKKKARQRKLRLGFLKKNRELMQKLVDILKDKKIDRKTIKIFEKLKKFYSHTFRKFRKKKKRFFTLYKKKIRRRRWLKKFLIIRIKTKKGIVKKLKNPSIFRYYRNRHRLYFHFYIPKYLEINYKTFCFIHLFTLDYSTVGHKIPFILHLGKVQTKVAF